MYSWNNKFISIFRTISLGGQIFIHACRTLENIFQFVVAAAFFTRPESLFPATTSRPVLSIEGKPVIFRTAALVRFWLQCFCIEAMLASIKASPRNMIFYVLFGLYNACLVLFYLNFRSIRALKAHTKSRHSRYT